MGCGCLSAKSTSISVTEVSAPIIPQPGSCDLTLPILNTWENLLLCVKEKNAYTLINSYEIVINQYLGLIQSAKNYPDNYCYYSTQLDKFKSTLLQKIIDNANFCI